MLNETSSTKTEAAYQLLRRDILTTRLMPGAPLKLSALRGTYGVGWTPLREALSRLEAERLVTAISNRGFAVAPVSRAELEDLARARMVVEIPLFLESMEKGGREWEDAVVTAHYRLSRCKTAVDDPSDAAVDRWDENHEAFHAALLSAATCDWLLRFRSTISDQLRRHHRFLGLAPTLRAAAGLKDGYEEAIEALREAIAIEHHTAIMEAALDRDIERAKALMTAHIGYTLHVYVHSEDSGATRYAARAGSLKAGSG
ncbi:GntR family transcriptional regulator [Mesorhizobium sp. B2-5-9]|uniref:GntR family transcriptional regulator n=1 Tax=unclassified Mesorhizobium TaxID=325217 RepID=UPI0011265AD3|nr:MULTISPECIES: GntR family transcriptional regulator [unclassified Mesorhizobium]TPK18920.1 GntR family transcriptional regulator [Mesorhizobium sp. B2-5-9]TPK70721.1 GntR family transcriptional regulator [Mesorhizobium sp. B2-4-18]TPK85127.1 GntR family transcriptional regulator [Mesorhizobium sp. B2-4-13]